MKDKGPENPVAITPPVEFVERREFPIDEMAIALVVAFVVVLLVAVKLSMTLGVVMVEEA